MFRYIPNVTRNCKYNKDVIRTLFVSPKVWVVTSVRHDHDNKRKVKGRSANLMDTVIELIAVKSKDKLSIWSDVEESVSKLTYGFHPQWHSMVLLHLANKDKLFDNYFEIGQSLYEYACKNSTNESLGLLLSYMQFCANHADANIKEEILLDIYDQILAKTDMFDSTSASILIRCLSKTRKWKECTSLIAMAKETSEIQSSYFSPYLDAASRNGDIELCFDILNDIAENRLAPDDEIFQSFCDYADENNFVRFLEYCRERSWIPSQSAADNIKGKFERSICQHCGTRLERPKQIPEADFKKLKEEFIKNAFMRNNVFLNSSPQEIEEFKDFLNKHQHFDIVVDALNLAFKLNQKASMPVRAKQVSKVVNWLSQKLGKKVLVIGRKHMSTWPEKDIKSIYADASVFLTSDDSSDDPFMLIAALSSGQNTYILTTDEFRDHCFLLSPNQAEKFKSWQRNHQVEFLNILRGKKQEKVSLKWPHLHETRIQRCKTGWHIPYDDGQMRPSYQLPQSWLCLSKVNKRTD